MTGEVNPSQPNGSDPGAKPDGSELNGSEGFARDVTPSDIAPPVGTAKEGDLPAERAGNRSVLRVALNLLSVVLVLFVVFLLWQRILVSGQASGIRNGNSSRQAGYASAAELANSIQLAPLPTSLDTLLEGIPRKLNPRTVIPNRPRVNVITYTVQPGDNLFAIAEIYGLKPETLLWGNFDTLEDNPHLLKPGQVLNILPTDGVYYQWKKGDNLDSVASSFQVDSQAILDYPGNQFDLTRTNTITSGIQSGTWLIIPGGKRPLKDWGPPAISRSNPAVARYYGPGACGSIYEGAIGTGTFVWPTTARYISGYHYSAIHRGIDIGGAMGNAIFAADSGVIVYAGWSNYGYGNLIVVDHGNGWQTAYAHLSSIAVTCGQSVFQGGYIGAMGSTGNSTGPHLHFEMVFNGAKPNPMDYLR